MAFHHKDPQKRGFKKKLAVRDDLPEYGDHITVPQPQPGCEIRHVRAMVREEGASGKYGPGIFSVEVRITDDPDQLEGDLIRGIRAHGYETRNIVEHSVKRGPQ